MKSMCSLGPAVFVLAFVILNGPSVAGSLNLNHEVLTPQASIESQCRGAVRAELKGPNCRQVVYVYHGPDDSCYVSQWSQPYFMDKVIQCIARGGPGRAAR